MNQMISAKKEELQNLFSTLGSQQIEIARQNQIIQRHQESSRRRKLSDAQQKQRIAQLEKEIQNLKNKHIFVKI